MAMVERVEWDAATQGELIRLQRALRRAQGFALYLAECNFPAHREALAAHFREALKRPIVTLSLPPAEADPIATIEDFASTAPQEAAIFVFGLENLLPSAEPERARQVLQRLNWRRSALRRLRRPLVFWVPTFIVPRLAEEAPDLWDWHSGFYEFPAPAHLREQVFQQALAPPGMGEALSAAEKEERLLLLQGLWEEYSGEEEAERRARLRAAYQIAALLWRLGRYAQARLWLERAGEMAQSL
ncbi:MAG: hypothetical protein ACUVV0_17400, partial [Anaerolineae bacterium]